MPKAFYTPSSFKKWKAVRDAAENTLNLIKTTTGMIDLFTMGTDLECVLKPLKFSAW